MARVRPLRSVIVLASLLLAAPVAASAERRAAAPAKPAAGASTKPAATTPATAPIEPSVTKTPTGPTPTGPTPTETTEPALPAEPEPEPATEEAPVARADAGEVAALQQDARALRDALFKARSRVSLVAAKLFTTRMTLRLRSNFDRFYTVSNLTLRVDGAPVYVQEKGMPSTDGDLFEVFAAPGSHELSVSADLVARRDATYKIRIDHTLVIAVDVDQRVTTRLLLRETGNMWRFAKGKRGHSDMHIGLRAKAKSTAKRGAGKSKAASTTVGASDSGGKK
jgi:hypothetical protein